MLRQDDPVADAVASPRASAPSYGAPPRALPIRYVLAWKVKHVRRILRGFRRKHGGIGVGLLTHVTAFGVAFGVGFLMAHYGA
jgi:hypothetical protein